MSTFRLRVDEKTMKKVIEENLQGRPTKTFTDYSSFGANCARLAQSLRQRTLGIGPEFTTEDMNKNPAGAYFVQVESALLYLANSLSEIATVLALNSIGSSDIDRIMDAAGKRLSQALGTPTDSGTDTRGMSADGKISAYIATHNDSLRELAKLYGLGLEGLPIGVVDASLRQDCEQMLEFLRKELETANTLFRSSGWRFWR